MKTLEITYKNGNKINFKVYDWEIKNGYLYTSEKSVCGMAVPVVTSIANMINVKEE